MGHTVSVEGEVADVSLGSPHVVLLGAGASRAAFPNGEGTGRRLPLMADFADIVPVKEILREAGLDPSGDFEDVYSAVASNPTMADTRDRLEDTVYEYFDALRLPEEPTLYDHLILSLRGKDVIATFNWDPFLIQAARRSGLREEQIPRLVFLHGNVFAGYCGRDSVMGPFGADCSKCGYPFQPMPLLYPVANKKYDQDPMIAHAWSFLDRVLERTFWFTIFGYSAPVSDESAVSLMRKPWGQANKVQLAQVEIIDVRREKPLLATWDEFIFSHHYQLHTSFYDSWIARHPRRTIEAFNNQYLEAKFIDDNPLPRDASLSELQEWFKPLLEVEDAAR